MDTVESVSLDRLYEQDETAWLEAMVEFIRSGRLDQLDYLNLAGYLEERARRDRQEVTNRLSTLIANLLKWRYQPERCPGGPRTREPGPWRRRAEPQRLLLFGDIDDQGA